MTDESTPPIPKPLPEQSRLPSMITIATALVLVVVGVVLIMAV